jgi:hypothetical protein
MRTIATSPTPSHNGDFIAFFAADVVFVPESERDRVSDKGGLDVFGPTGVFLLVDMFARDLCPVVLLCPIDPFEKVADLCCTGGWAVG